LKDQRNNGEFHRADPGRRRHMQVLLVATVVVAVAALAGLHLWLSRLAAHASGDPGAYHHALKLAMGGLCLVFALAAGVFAIWLFGLAKATHAERRWPPSSMHTSSDVRIRYLTSADALVAQMKGGAIVLALLALALGGWGIWVLRAG